MNKFVSGSNQEDIATLDKTEKKNRANQPTSTKPKILPEQWNLYRMIVPRIGKFKQPLPT